MASRTKIQTTTEFGQAVRARRRQLGLSQADVADVVGTNRRVIGELEGGKPTVQLRIAVEVARALGLNIELGQRGDG